MMRPAVDLTIDAWRHLGANPDGVRRIAALIREWTNAGKIPAISVTAGRAAGHGGALFSGTLSATGEGPLVSADTVFLTASLTKPVMASAVLKLVEQGRLSLSEPVRDWLPVFRHQGFHGITIRHLLTHTSGLCDLPADNRDLRAAHAGVEEFLERTVAEGTSFPPGRGIQYQSMGYAALGEIIARVTGRSCRDDLQEAILAPLDMVDSTLGMPSDAGVYESWTSRTASVAVPPDQAGQEDWNWNSRYWRTLGAAWGGLYATTDDLARFARMWLSHGIWDGKCVLSPAMTAVASASQTDAYAEIPDTLRHSRPWGFGWRMLWPAHATAFADGVSADTYGHWGATGTLVWIDPRRDLFAVILTTQPHASARRLIVRLSNAIVTAFA